MAEILDQTAQNRLAESGRLFTSDLSVAEFTLLEHTGFEPLELVMGVSVYHIGFQPGRGMQAGEYAVLSQAMYTARMNAIQRLVAETVKVGADGVVGVKLGYRSHGPDSLEFTAIGTAVKLRGGSPPALPPPRGPTITTPPGLQEVFPPLHLGPGPPPLLLRPPRLHLPPPGVGRAPGP